MRQKNKKRQPHFIRQWAAKPLFALLSAAMVGCLVSAPFVSADSLQHQISNLSVQNAQNQSNLSSLQLKATSYQDAINKLQSQIDGLQQAISINQNKQDQLQQKIEQAQAELDKQKQILGADIKAMYVDGQITTIEELATSKNLSDFVDAETYRNAVQDKVQSTLDEVTQLQNQLKDQKAQVDQLLALQTQQQNQLAASQTKQNQLLAYNESQQTNYNQKIQSNQKKIDQLTAEQIAANRALVGTGHVDYSGTCGGSYPASAAGPFGKWGCNYPLDNTIDNWGMYNRECVSYTAWMVYKTYGYMPDWGGVGNANEWPGDAQAAHIPTGSTPKVGSVAIYMGGGSDPFGHAMWVTAVNSNGTITVDQYNLYYDGKFYETTIPSSGLTYIYFGG